MQEINEDEIIIFEGKYCTACKTLKERIDKLYVLGKLKKKIRFLNAESEGRALAIKYHIRGLPTILQNGNTYVGLPGTDEALLNILN